MFAIGLSFILLAGLVTVIMPKQVAAIPGSRFAWLQTTLAGMVLIGIVLVGLSLLIGLPRFILWAWETMP